MDGMIEGSLSGWIDGWMHKWIDPKKWNFTASILRYIYYDIPSKYVNKYQ